jgi:hypothetical protein
VILAVGVFHLSTIRRGHDWGDDFAMYIGHARNIAEGVPYADTGFVHNPLRPMYAPPAYPPVFPLILAPIHTIAGLNLTAMKMELVVLFLAALGLIALMAGTELSSRDLAAMAILVGFNPFFWNFKDSVLSDIPFLLFVFMSFHFIEAFHRSGPRRCLFGIAAVISVCLAYGTRSLGLVFVPCLLLHDALRFRRLSGLTMAIGVSLVACRLLEGWVGVSGAYGLGQLSLHPRSVIQNIRIYAEALTAFWDNGHSRALCISLSILISAIALVGYWTLLRRRISLQEIFLPTYLAVILAWPGVQGTRFLIPVFPLILFYLFVGMRRLLQFSRARIQTMGFAAMLVLTLLTYAGAYVRQDFGPIREGMAKRETRELFEFIRGTAGPDDLVLFRKPRALALYARTRTSIWPDSENDEVMREHLRKSGARYVILGAGPQSPLPRGPQSLVRFVEERPDIFRGVYSNADFEVYRADWSAEGPR